MIYVAKYYKTNGCAYLAKRRRLTFDNKKNDNMTLKELQIGKSAQVTVVRGEGANRQHILDMGVIPGVTVKLVKVAPMGDPLELQVHGYALALRKADADMIDIADTEGSDDADIWHTGEQTRQERDIPYIENLPDHNPHPGIGEDDDLLRSAQCRREHKNKALPEGTRLTFALAGQQNCGKTTLFNQLTGSRQHVGNFPGVTVDRKDGIILGHDDTSVTDLPGIYSLSTYTEEELVSRQFILQQHPKGIINIVDAGNIERNLYLTMQLMELDIPMVLALNMMDEMRNNGGTVRVNEMERILGIPVVPISAAKNEGIDELVDHALHVAKYQERPLRQDFCDKEDNGGAVHRCLHGIMHLIEDHATAAGIPLRFAATKVVEGDGEVLAALRLDTKEMDAIEDIVQEMEHSRGLDRAAAIADMRFSFIRRLCRQSVVKPRESKEYLRSRKIDKVLTGRWTALPIFVAVMAAVIYLSIELLGGPLQGLLEMFFEWLGTVSANAMTRWGVSEVVQSLVVDGVISGVGAVASFVPIIILLFFFLSLLEDSGYMARVAFVTDKLLRRVGLSGRSIVPLLVGFGCSVPAIMSSRTLPSRRDRRLTVLLIPFMSCSAKIPIYGFFAANFFPENSWIVTLGMYLLGIVVGIAVAAISKHIGSKSQAAPFVMELPNYRMPGAKNVGHLLWDKTKDFLQRAFTVIFLATIVIWFLQKFDFHFGVVENGAGSMLATIAGVIAPIFRPMGLDSWQVVTALVSGFMAKESVVMTLEVLDAVSVVSALTAIPLVVFCLLYTPCVAAIATVKREQGTRAAVAMVLFQCVVAWLVSYVAYLIASLLV